MSNRWRHRPEGSNWGEFGPGDQLGRLNLLTPRKVLEGIAEAKEGLRFCLSLPLDYPGGTVANPRRHPPRLFAAELQGECFYNHIVHRPDGTSGGVVCDDAVLLYTQYSTQWDGFAHFGAQFDADGDGTPEIVYYNGWRAGSSIVSPAMNEQAEPWARFEGPAARALGIEHIAAAAVQGRGVLVDLHSRFGRERRAVTYAELEEIMEADGVRVEPGDILCLYTGFDRVVLEMKKQPSAIALHQTCCGLDGTDQRLLRWITETNVAAIVSDNRAVEILPAIDPARSPYSAPLHAHCLFKLGIPLGEMWFLADLAQWLRSKRRNRFLLTAPPLRLPGAVGSPVTPVATV